tara:strand:+ start:248 stop:586 length:339 start_codon:yes stop_codon:yes gene_type:complete
VVTWDKLFNLLDLLLVSAPFSFHPQLWDKFGKEEDLDGPNGSALVELVCLDIKHQDTSAFTPWATTINIEITGWHIASLNHTTDGREDKSSLMPLHFIDIAFLHIDLFKLKW